MAKPIKMTRAENRAWYHLAWPQAYEVISGLRRRADERARATGESVEVRTRAGETVYVAGVPRAQISSWLGKTWADLVASAVWDKQLAERRGLVVFSRDTMQGRLYLTSRARAQIATHGTDAHLVDDRMDLTESLRWNAES